MKPYRPPATRQELNARSMHAPSKISLPRGCCTPTDPLIRQAAKPFGQQRDRKKARNTTGLRTKEHGCYRKALRFVRHSRALAQTTAPLKQAPAHQPLAHMAPPPPPPLLGNVAPGDSEPPPPPPRPRRLGSSFRQAGAVPLPGRSEGTAGALEGHQALQTPAACQGSPATSTASTNKAFTPFRLHPGLRDPGQEKKKSAL